MAGAAVAAANPMAGTPDKAIVMILAIVCVFMGIMSASLRQRQNEYSVCLVCWFSPSSKLTLIYGQSSPSRPAMV